MEIKKLLQQIGFTELESHVYLILTARGPSTTGDVAKELNIQRSTAHYLLENLNKKGFVVFSMKGKRKLFQACNPNYLVEYAHQTYVGIKDAIPTLLVKEPIEEKDEALMFQGYHGLVSAYELMLAETKPGEEFLILGARGGEDSSKKTYRAFYKNYNKRRIEKKINQRVIMNSELKKDIGKYYEKLQRTKVRYLDQYTLVAIVIYPRGIAIVQWKEKPSLFLLVGKSIKESFKQYFETMWDVAR